MVKTVRKIKLSKKDPELIAFIVETNTHQTADALTQFFKDIFDNEAHLIKVEEKMSRIEANIREVTRQRAVLQRKVRESRTLPPNDKTAKGRNQKQMTLRGE